MTQEAAQILVVLVLAHRPSRFETGAAFKRHYNKLAKDGFIRVWDGPDPEGGSGTIKLCEPTDAGTMHVVKALGTVVAAFKAE